MKLTRRTRACSALGAIVLLCGAVLVLPAGGAAGGGGVGIDRVGVGGGMRVDRVGLGGGVKVEGVGVGVGGGVGVGVGGGVGIDYSGGLVRARAGARTRSPLAGSPRGVPGGLRYRPVGCGASGPLEARTHGPFRRDVALTFDDGPSAYTRSFVQMLRAQHAVATFFMIGKQLGGYAGTLREELRDGDALGDHTWTHANLLGAGDAQSQLQRTKSAIASLSGYAPCVFRPPYGAYDSSVVRLARSLGLVTVTWNVDPSDYLLPGVGAIQQRVLAQAQPGSIILSHDGGGPRGQTLAAYPHIIAALRARGYRFLTVPQLLGLRTIYRRCRRDCGEAEIGGSPPPGSIVEAG
jgi:peptidoglycan-N-acetylglucosamine deacetylase